MGKHWSAGVSRNLHTHCTSARLGRHIKKGKKSKSDVPWQRYVVSETVTIDLECE